jgi:hypothetical protein
VQRIYGEDPGVGVIYGSYRPPEFPRKPDPPR